MKNLNFLNFSSLTPEEREEQLHLSWVRTSLLKIGFVEVRGEKDVLMADYGQFKYKIRLIGGMGSIGSPLNIALDGQIDTQWEGMLIWQDLRKKFQEAVDRSLLLRTAIAFSYSDQYGSIFRKQSRVSYTDPIAEALDTHLSDYAKKLGDSSDLQGVHDLKNNSIIFFDRRAGIRIGGSIEVRFDDCGDGTEDSPVKIFRTGPEVSPLQLNFLNMLASVSNYKQRVFYCQEIFEDSLDIPGAMYIFDPENSQPIREYNLDAELPQLLQVVGHLVTSPEFKDIEVVQLKKSIMVKFDNKKIFFHAMFKSSTQPYLVSGEPEALYLFSKRWSQSVKGREAAEFLHFANHYPLGETLSRGSSEFDDQLERIGWKLAGVDGNAVIFQPEDAHNIQQVRLEISGGEGTKSNPYIFKPKKTNKLMDYEYATIRRLMQVIANLTGEDKYFEIGANVALNKNYAHPRRIDIVTLSDIMAMLQKKDFSCYINKKEHFVDWGSVLQRGESYVSKATVTVEGNAYEAEVIFKTESTFDSPIEIYVDLPVKESNAVAEALMRCMMHSLALERDLIGYVLYINISLSIHQLYALDLLHKQPYTMDLFKKGPISVSFPQTTEQILRRDLNLDHVRYDIHYDPGQIMVVTDWQKKSKVNIHGYAQGTGHIFVDGDVTIIQDLKLQPANKLKVISLAHHPAIVGDPTGKLLAEPEPTYEQPRSTTLFEQPVVEIPGLAAALEQVAGLEKVKFDEQHNSYSVTLENGTKQNFKAWRVNNLVIISESHFGELWKIITDNTRETMDQLGLFLIINRGNGYYTVKTDGVPKLQEISFYEVEELAHVSSYLTPQEFYKNPELVPLTANRSGSYFNPIKVDKLNADMRGMLGLRAVSWQTPVFVDVEDMLGTFVFTPKGELVRISNTPIFKNDPAYLADLPILNTYNVVSDLEGENTRYYLNTYSDLGSESNLLYYALTGMIAFEDLKSTVQPHIFAEALFSQVHDAYFKKYVQGYAYKIDGPELYERIIDVKHEYVGSLLRATLRLIEFFVEAGVVLPAITTNIAVIELIFELGLHKKTRHLAWARRARDVMLSEMYRQNPAPLPEIIKKLKIAARANYMVFALHEDFWLEGNSQLSSDELDPTRSQDNNDKGKNWQPNYEKMPFGLPLPSYAEDFQFKVRDWQTAIGYMQRLAGSRNIALIEQVSWDMQYADKPNIRSQLPHPLVSHIENIFDTKNDISQARAELRGFTKKYNQFTNMAPTMAEVANSPWLQEKIKLRVIAIIEFLASGKVLPANKILLLKDQKNRVHTEYWHDENFISKVSKSPLIRWLATLENEAIATLLLNSIENQPVETLVLFKYLIFDLGRLGLSIGIGKVDYFMAEKILASEAVSYKDRLEKLAKVLLELGKEREKDHRQSLLDKLAEIKTRTTADLHNETMKHLYSLADKEFLARIEIENATHIKEKLEAEYEKLSQPESGATENRITRVINSLQRMSKRQVLTRVGLSIVSLLLGAFVLKSFKIGVEAEALFWADANSNMPDFSSAEAISQMPTRVLGRVLHNGLGEISSMVIPWQIENYTPQIVGSQIAHGITSAQVENMDWGMIPGVPYESYVRFDNFESGVVYPSGWDREIAKVFLVGGGSDPRQLEVGRLGEVYLGDFQGEIVVVEVQVAYPPQQFAAGAVIIPRARPQSITIAPLGEDISAILPPDLLIPYQNTRNQLLPLVGQTIPTDQFELIVRPAFDAIGREFDEIDYGVGFSPRGNDLSPHGIFQEVFVFGNQQGVSCSIAGNGTIGYLESLISMNGVALDAVNESDGQLLSKVGHFYALGQGYIQIDNTPPVNPEDAEEIANIFQLSQPSMFAQASGDVLAKIFSTIKAYHQPLIGFALAGGIWQLAKFMRGRWRHKKDKIIYEDKREARRQEIIGQMAEIARDEAAADLLVALASSEQLSSPVDISVERGINQHEANFNKQMMYLFTFNSSLRKKDLLLILDLLVEVRIESKQDFSYLTGLSKNTAIVTAASEKNLVSSLHSHEKIADICELLDASPTAVMLAILMSASRQTLVNAEKNIIKNISPNAADLVGSVVPDDNQTLFWDVLVQELDLEKSEGSILRLVLEQLVRKPAYGEFSAVLTSEKVNSLPADLGVAISDPAEKLTAEDLRNLRSKASKDNPLFSNLLVLL